MPTTMPALLGRFGSTEYYLTTMKAGTLVEKLKIPKELPEWEGLTIEERFQREINYNRVKNHIAPYLATDNDRFFGALIVDMYNSEGISFEPLSEVGTKIPKAYSAHSFGFLHLTGGEVLVPLDGQHRLAAFRFAITGKDEKNRDIEGFPPNFDVAGDDVTVILIKHDEKKARKIFNKVNRYAKPTSKAENLITADDDIVAVITREIANDVIGQRLVNYQSNTLTQNAVHFTTLSALYDGSLKILEMSYNEKVDTTTVPDKAKQTLYRNEVRIVWDRLVDDISLFRLALADRNPGGDEKRKEVRANYLLGKPIAQFCLVVAFMRLRATAFDGGTRLGDEEICRRLDSVDWSVGNPLWQRVLLNGDRVVAGRQIAMFAARFVSYLVGENLSNVEVEALEQNYLSWFSPDERKGRELPEAMFGAP